jgi:xanthine/uracil permease
MLAITDLYTARVGFGVALIVAILSLVPYLNVLIAVVCAADIAYILYRKYGK